MSDFLASRTRSFVHALRGLALMLRSQRNAWIHAAATLAVCALGLTLGLTREQWCWIVLAIAGVWTAEALNTAVELLADAVSPQAHPLVRGAKDVAAAAVLVAALAAASIGLLVLGPALLGAARG